MSIFKPQYVRDIVEATNNIIKSEEGFAYYVECLKEVTGISDIVIEENNKLRISGKVFKGKEELLNEAEKVYKEYAIPKEYFGTIYDILKSRTVFEREALLDAITSSIKIKGILTKTGICLDCTVFYDLDEMKLYFSRKTDLFLNIVNKVDHFEYIADGDGVLLDGVAIVFRSHEALKNLQNVYSNYAVYGVYNPVSKSIDWLKENIQYFKQVAVKGPKGTCMHFLEYLIQENIYTVAKHKPFNSPLYFEKPYPVAKSPSGEYLYAFENPNSKIVKGIKIAKKLVALTQPKEVV